MYQKWRALTFLHFPCDPSEVQATLPSSLTVDTFPDETGREMAWIGLVPFRMKGIRPRFLPPMPGISAFPETNVRTYVHCEGQAPGVWFYSLDAARLSACVTARVTFGLPYFHAAMRVEEGEQVQYVSTRHTNGANHEISVVPGEALGEAKPGSLEFFLVERYLLYSRLRGRMVSGRVHHHPYPLQAAETPIVRESLVEAAGLRPRPFVHCLYSPGVDVKIFAPSVLS